MTTPYRQKLGKRQQIWLDRIREAGGSLEMSVHWTPVIMLKVEGGNDIRVPIREFEGLYDRGLFEEVESPGHKVEYRLKDRVQA